LSGYQGSRIQSFYSINPGRIVVTRGITESRLVTAWSRGWEVRTWSSLASLDKQRGRGEMKEEGFSFDLDHQAPSLQVGTRTMSDFVAVRLARMSISRNR